MLESLASVTRFQGECSASRRPGRSSMNPGAGLLWHCPRPPGIRASVLLLYDQTPLSFSPFPPCYSLSLFLPHSLSPSLSFSPLSLSFSHSFLSISLFLTPSLSLTFFSLSLPSQSHRCSYYLFISWISTFDPDWLNSALYKTFFNHLRRMPCRLPFALSVQKAFDAFPSSLFLSLRILYSNYNQVLQFINFPSISI